MKKLLLVSISILYLLSSIELNAQNLILVDSENGLPVSHALIFNESKTISILSDEKGIVPLNPLKKYEVIYIQHSSYSLTKLDILTINSDTILRLESRKIELGEILISASQKIESSREIPRKITSISKEEISFYHAQTSADMLENSGQVFVQKSQQGGGSPMIRGFAANRILLVYDNIRMNNAISRGGNLHNMISVDPNFLEKTEVIYGPGTVVYGSDALGGVVHMRSEEITLGSETMKLRGDVALNYSTANNGKVGHIDLGGANNKWGWHSSLTYGSFDDLRMGSKGPEEYLRDKYVKTENGHDVEVMNEDDQIQRFSGYDQYSLAQKFSFKLSEHTELQIFGQLSGTSDIPRYDRLTEEVNDTLKYAEWYYGPQMWALAGLKLKSVKKRSWSDMTSVSVHYQNWQESRHDRKFNQEYLNERYENLHIIGASADASKNLMNNQNLSYGLSFYSNNVSSSALATSVNSGNTQDINTRYPDNGSDLILLGVYLGYKNRIKSRMVFTTGLRYTYQFLESRFTEKVYLPFNDKIELNTGAISGSAGLTYKASEIILLKGNLTSGFRAPNIDDIAKVFDPEPSTVVVPNVELKPEYLYSAEFGIEFSDSKTWWFDASAFYSYLDGAIVRDDYELNGLDSIVYNGELKQIQSLVNKDYAIIYGFGFGLRYSFIDDFQFKINYIITRGSDSDHDPLRHVSPDFGDVHLIYNPGKLKIDLFVRYHNGLESNQLAPSEINKDHIYAVDDNGNPFSPRWATVNLMGLYHLNKHISIEAGIENLTGIRYRTYSSGIAASGRNFVFGIKSKL